MENFEASQGDDPDVKRTVIKSSESKLGSPPSSTATYRSPQFVLTMPSLHHTVWTS